MCLLQFYQDAGKSFSIFYIDNQINCILSIFLFMFLLFMLSLSKFLLSMLFFVLLFFSETIFGIKGVIFEVVEARNNTILYHSSWVVGQTFTQQTGEMQLSFHKSLYFKAEIPIFCFFCM